MRCKVCGDEFEPKPHGRGKARACPKPDCKAALRQQRKVEAAPSVQKDISPEQLTSLLQGEMPPDEAMLFWSTDWFHPELTREEIWGEAPVRSIPSETI